MDFVTLSYIQTSDEGVQINILYEKNIGCHFFVLSSHAFSYHQLAIYTIHATLKLKIDQLFKHASLLKHSLCGSNQILIKNADAFKFSVKEGKSIKALRNNSMDKKCLWFNGQSE